jgi:hypothetical protein
MSIKYYNRLATESLESAISALAKPFSEVDCEINVEDYQAVRTAANQAQQAAVALFVLSGILEQMKGTK